MVSPSFFCWISLIKMSFGTRSSQELWIWVEKQTTVLYTILHYLRHAPIRLRHRTASISKLSVKVFKICTCHCWNFHCLLIFNTQPFKIQHKIIYYLLFILHLFINNTFHKLTSACQSWYSSTFWLSPPLPPLGHLRHTCQLVHMELRLSYWHRVIDIVITKTK